MIIHASEVFTVDTDTKSIDMRCVDNFDIPELSYKNHLDRLLRPYLALDLLKKILACLSM